MLQLHDKKQYPIGEVQFLKEAADQVVTCRRVLKYTYAFGYYLPPGHEKNLFEHLQEKLEENTEHLHELVEKDLNPFLDELSTDRSPFYHYKSELTNYYAVTKQFLTNLLDGIESGLTATF
jgi:ariadne-1